MSKTEIAIIGNSLLSDLSPKQVQTIDSYGRVMRINGAGEKSVIHKYADFLGYKMIDYAWNCYMSYAPFREMKSFVQCFLTVPIGPNKYLYFSRDFETEIRKKFIQISHIRRLSGEFWNRVYMESGLHSRPTTGILMIYYYIFEGLIPVLFNFNMDKNLKHYYNNSEIQNGGSHNIEAETLLLNNLRKHNRIIYG